MSALLVYVETHPWWTLVYLIIISSALNGLIRVTVGKKP